MRKIKKITAMFLLLMFSLSLVPFVGLAQEADDASAGAAVVAEEKSSEEATTKIFSDVNSETAHSVAIEELFTRKIVDGYVEADGSKTFKPDATITRGEFAKLLAVAMPNIIKLDMSQTVSGFSDVDSDATVSWTIPYVKAAVSASVINGYEDGTFRAKNPVTYAEAVKMIVCAMGYSTKIPVTDPWYDGYILVGNQLKITYNALSSGNYEEAVTRGLVAELIINMVKSENIVTTIPGTDTSISSGSFNDPDDDKETIDDEYGMMVGAFDNTIDGEDMGLSKVQFKVNDIVFDLGDKLNIEDMKELVGYDVEVTYEKVRNKNVATKVVKGDFSNYSLNDEQINNFEGGRLYYNEDEESKEKSFTFNDETYIFYNGNALGQVSTNDLSEILEITNGYVDMIDNDSNKVIDVAYVYNYTTYFVGASDISRYIVTDYFTKETITLDQSENEYITFKLANSTGKLTDSQFSAITAKSVLSVALPYDDDPDAKIEVIISKNSVTGNVTRKSNEYFTINDKKYTTSDYYNTTVSFDDNQNISVGDYGKYYLDFTGKIVCLDAATISDQYGYIITLESDDGNLSTDDDRIKLITSKNSTPALYTLKSRVSVNGVTVDARKVADLLFASANRINIDNGRADAGYAYNATYSQPIIFKTTNATSKIISSIKTIANGELENESALEYGIGALEGANKLSYYSSGYQFKNSSGEKVYSMTTASTHNHKVNVFVVPEDRQEETEYQSFTSTAYFKGGIEYVVEGINVDPTSQYAGFVIVYGGTPLSIDGSYGAKIVKDITEDWDDEEGESVKKLTYLDIGVKDPQPKTIICKEASLLDDISRGDIIKFATKNNANTEIALIQKVYVGGDLYEPLDEDNNQSLATDYNCQQKYGSDPDYFNSFIAKVNFAEGNNLKLHIGHDTTVPEQDFTITSGAHVLIVTKSELATDEGIKYYPYNKIALTTTMQNGEGLEDFIYAQKVSSQSYFSSIVIFRD